MISILLAGIFFLMPCSEIIMEKWLCMSEIPGSICSETPGSTSAKWVALFRPFYPISDITDYKVQGEVHSSPPCTIGLHFLYRDNALNLTVYMRSNDAYLGLPHDLFCFSMLQEMVSVKLGMRLGKYTHICTSLHVYDKHLERVNRYLQEGLFEQLPMPVMSEFDDRILQYIVEAYQNKDGIIELNTDEHPSYWHDFALFSNKYFSKNSPEDWLSLFRTEELKKIAINSVTT